MIRKICLLFYYPNHLRPSLSRTSARPAYNAAPLAERELITIRHFVRSPLVTSIFYDTT